MKDLLKRNKIKYAFIAIVFLFSILAMWKYINTYLYKSKAANPQVQLGFMEPFPVASPQTTVIKPGEEFFLPVFVGSGGGEMISGIELHLTYTPGLQYTSFDLANQSPLLFDEKVDERNDGSGDLKIVLVAKKGAGSLQASTTFYLKFKSPNAGTVTFTMDRANSVVVGSSLSNPKFDFKEGDVTTKSITIGAEATSTPVPTATPTIYETTSAWS